MKLLAPTLLFISTLLLSACSSPITYDVRFQNVGFDASKRKTIVTSAINLTDRTKISDLTTEIMSLGKNIDRTEASFVAREAVLYPQYLANQYRLIGPPNSHNQLVNRGQREKGLCFHWAKDMTDHIVKGRTYNTLTLQRAVANQGGQFEHNVLTVAAKGKGIKDAIILDAWRNSATLLFLKTSEDPNYDWTKYYPRAYILRPDGTRQYVKNPAKPAL
ncbi:MAG: hypothetical protein L3J51_11105 [Cocleimonas sp.]|nr:hypothetical protein [Cocleimonas sp.]